MVGGLQGGGKTKKDVVPEILNLTEDFSEGSLNRLRVGELEALQRLLVGNLFSAPRGVKTRDVGVNTEAAAGASCTTTPPAALA
eukprot:13386312-Heterocapsa_arctica.AAC.1